MTDTINGRTPDEIKKGLELIGCNDIVEFLKAADKGIDYDCNEAVAKDALAYIQQLETERHQLLTKCERLERERDAAVRAISDAQHYIKNLGAVHYGLQQLEKWDYCIKQRVVYEKSTKEKQNMIIIPELKKIAAANDKIEKLSKIVEAKIDTDDLWIKGATLIDGCSEKNGHLFQNGCQLDNGGLTDNTYYCDQHCGYCEDDFYGTLYFKTNVPGQFVAVPFH